MPAKKNNESKYDDSRYVDMAIKVLKPAKPLKTAKKKGTKTNGKGK